VPRESVDVVSVPPADGHGPCRSVEAGPRRRRRPRRSPTSGSNEPSFGVPPGSVQLEARVQLTYDN